MIKNRQMYNLIYSFLLAVTLYGWIPTTFAAAPSMQVSTNKPTQTTHLDVQKKSAISPRPAHKKTTLNKLANAWRSWYKFRQPIYLANSFIANVSLLFSENNTSLNILDSARTSLGYEELGKAIYPSHPLIAAKGAVGIVDALLAQKSIKNTIKEDLCEYVAYYGCRITLDALEQAALNHSIWDHAIMKQPKTLIKPFTDKAPHLTKITHLLSLFIKHKIANSFSYCVGKPVGYVAGNAVQSSINTFKAAVNACRNT